MALTQLPGPLHAPLEQVLRHRDLPGPEELVMGQRVADGVVIDLHVRQQSQQVRLALEGISQGIDLLAQLVNAGLERGAIGGRHGDPLGGTGRTRSTTLSAGPSPRTTPVRAMAIDSRGSSLRHDMDVAPLPSLR